MGEALIEGSNWRLVEVGRVVLLTDNHPFAGRIAAIVEIIDHKRVRSTTFLDAGPDRGVHRNSGMELLYGIGNTDVLTNV